MTVLETLPRGTALGQSRAFERELALALFGALIVTVAAVRVPLAAATFDLAIDGGFYADVARAVRDGEGLATRISLYHQGFTTFPHPSTIYPLWPLVLGLVACVVPMLHAGVWFPTTLFFVALALAYALGRRHLPRVRGVPVVNGGHLLVALLALGAPLARATVTPYTEALALVVVLAFLLRVDGLIVRRDVRAGVELGLWLAMAYLVRSQNSVVVVAAMPMVALAARQDGARGARFMAAAGAAFLVGVAPFVVHLVRSLDEPSWRSLVFFESARQAGPLSVFDPYVHHATAGGWIAARVSALKDAFNLRGGLAANFGIAVLLIPASLVLVVVKAWRPRRVMRLRPSAALALLSGTLTIVALALVEKEYFTRWAFARRHAMLVVFVVFAAAVLFARARVRLLRATPAVVVTIAFAMGLSVQVRAKRALGPPSAEERGRDEVAARLAFEAKERGRPLVVAASHNEAQRIAWRTDADLGWHWVWRGTTAADLDHLVDTYGVEVLVTRTRGKPDGGAPSELERRFVVEKKLPGGFLMWRARAALTGGVR